MGKKFTCKSEAQKRAIKRAYAVRNSKIPNENLSNDKIPIGRTVSIYDADMYKNPSDPTKKRTHVIIEKNSSNQLAVVPFSSKNNKHNIHLKNYLDGKTYVKPYIEVEDKEGNPLIIGDKIQANHKNQDVSKTDIKYIKYRLLNKSVVKDRNVKMLDKFRKK